MDTTGRKTRKRSSRDIQDANDPDFETSVNGNSDNIQNHSPQSNDAMSTLAEIKKTLAQILAMQQIPDPSSNSHSKWPVIEGMIKDIQESIEYLIEMKNDGDEIKITLTEMNSKISAIMEKQEGSAIDVNQIMTSIPYTTLCGVEKVEQYLNGSTIFAQLKEEFSRIGGHPDKMAVTMLNKLIAKNVQGQLTWNDSGMTIHIFKNVLRLIHSVCKANSVTYTEKDGNEALKAALKNARSKN